MADKFDSQAPGLTSPGIDATAVSPSDSTDLSYVTRGLYVGGSGDVRVDMLDGSTVTFQSMQAGGFYPLRIRRIYATGTNASGLVAVG